MFFCWSMPMCTKLRSCKAITLTCSGGWWRIWRHHSFLGGTYAARPSWRGTVAPDHWSLREARKEMRMKRTDTETQKQRRIQMQPLGTSMQVMTRASSLRWKAGREEADKQKTAWQCRHRTSCLAFSHTHSKKNTLNYLSEILVGSKRCSNASN